MNYDKEMVANYCKMMEDYNNDYILDIFCEKIPKEASVLELGFGTGKDYLHLKDFYNITASDYSQEFINVFNQNYNDKVLTIDAITIEVEDKFDCIYSSKVLNSLNEDQIIESFKRQYQVLNKGGYIFHTLWYGDKEEDDSFIDKQTLIKILELDYEFVEFNYYKEADFIESEYDSVIIIGRK
ncbi:class I SAM-dependent methyltransferase [Mollicutes bacterium LVI A0078]|nr:class I SAM-dependent methyltransferase [Mollicutes bacterium LVI A0075]WOO91460.1 class I SAM-dependent methyltransferase [Mollicutes bacterium LVI A0078]